MWRSASVDELVEEVPKAQALKVYNALHEDQLTGGRAAGIADCGGSAQKVTQKIFLRHTRLHACARLNTSRPYATVWTIG